MCIRDRLYIESNFNYEFEYFKTKDYLYDYYYDYIRSNKLMEWKQNPQNNYNCQNVTIDFYDGFAINIIN